MTKKIEKGSIPSWLEKNTAAIESPSKREEIEAKFILRKKDVQTAIKQPGIQKYTLEQFYLPVEVVECHLPKGMSPDDLRGYSEWRIRKKNDAYLFTCKKEKNGANGVREEYEIEISEQIYTLLKKQTLRNEDRRFVKKTRYTRFVNIAQQRVSVEIDVYSETGAGKMDLDFVTCEVEVPSVKILELVRTRAALHPELNFLSLGVDATGNSELANKNLARNGFNKNNFNEYKVWLQKRIIADLVTWVDDQETLRDEEWKQLFSHKIEQFSSFGLSPSNYVKLQEQSEYIKAQGALQSLALKTSDSIGRSNKNGNLHQQTMDKLGYGWLKDFHTITSSDPYLRLSWKPQVFRPGLGHNNTTTRGAHTLDVISCSAQISRQLGLNTELCMAIAAMHDIGHPAGGHIGERILFDLSGREFKHHVFSLSLADLFSMNLLREVQVGAFFHKSHGGKLEAPENKPQEFGVVRIADKLAYVAWDFYDSVRNEFIRKEDIPDNIYSVLGKEPLDWINTFIKAVVLESATLYNVSFSSFSKEVFDAYEKAKTLIYHQVHRSIEWRRLKTDYSLTYEGIKKSFPDLDPVPIIAYMTDAELVQVAKIFEALPKNKVVDYKHFSEQGFGFLDIVDILITIPGDDQKIYYASAEGKL